MRTYVVVVLLGLLGCSSGGAVDHPSDEKSIAETRKKMTRIYNSGNAAGVVQFYEDGCTYMPQHQEAMNRDEMRAFLTESFRMFLIHIVVGSEQVSWMGDDWAADRGTYDLTLQRKLGGAALMERGKYLLIWHRQEDGSWKITHDIDNTNQEDPK